MANEVTKQLKTRISLKIGDYAYWTTGAGKDIELIKGEVCICTVAAADNQATTAPTVLFKVCDRTGQKFGDLKWVSGLAADVYAWAKKENPDWTDFPALPLEVVDNGTGKFVTDFTYAGNKLTITRADVALDDISDKEKIALSADLGNVATLKTTAKTVVGAINEHDAEIGDLANLDTDNKSDLVTAINEVRQAVEVGGTGSVVTVRKDNENKYTVRQGSNDVAVSIEIADGTLTVKGENGLTGSGTFGANQAEDGTITLSHANTSDVANVAKEARKYVAGVTFDDFGHVTAVEMGEETVVDTNTAHTHAAGDGLKLGDVKGGIEGEVKYELNLKFGELNDNKLQLLDATNNAVIAEFNAAAFVEDSYLDNVTYKDENGDNVLEFTFTLSDGSTRTVDVDLSHLVDVYTADETTITLVTSGDGKVFKVKEAGIETKHIKDENVTEMKLEKNVRDALALARTAIQEHQVITHKADKVTGAVAGNFAGLDANGNLVDSGKKAGDFEVAGAAATAEQNAKGYADGLVKDYGDIVTHNAAEFATNAENGAKALADQNKLAIDAINNVDTGILAQAKKDAADKAAVVLGEAQKYADDKVAALAGEGNTTTVAALAGRVNTLETAGHLTEVVAKDYDEEGNEKVSGLKVQNKNEIAIDDSVVFILDCNW